MVVWGGRVAAALGLCLAHWLTFAGGQVLFEVIEFRLPDEEVSRLTADTGNPSEPQYDAASNVYRLSDQCFNTFIKAHPSALVVFHAPWCHWCRSLLPKFAEAARSFPAPSDGDFALPPTPGSAPPVAFAQVDATKNPNVTDAYNITAYPTLKFFLDGISHDYTGGRSAYEISEWVKRHLVTEIFVETKKDLEEFLTKAQKSSQSETPDEVSLEASTKLPALLAYFPPTKPMQSPSHLGYSALSRNLIDKAVFGTTTSAPIIEEAMRRLDINFMNGKERGRKMASGFVVLINPHYQRGPSTPQPSGAAEVIVSSIDTTVQVEPPGILFRGEIEDSAGIEHLAKTFTFPALTKFDSEVAPSAFQDGRPIFTLFTEPSPSADDTLTRKAIAVTKLLGKALRWDVLFIHSDGHSVVDRRLKTLLGAEHDQLPTVRLFRPNPQGHGSWHTMLKYKPPPSALETFDYDAMRQFVQKFFEGTLKAYVRSETPPDPRTNVGPVKVLVADTFDQLVHETRKDVLVDFYAPWCGHCIRLEPIYKAAAEALQNVPHIDVFSFDASQNEAHDIVIVGYPTIAFFPASKKSGGKKTPIYFSGGRNVADIVRFVAENSSVKFDANAVLRAAEGRAMREGKSWLMEEL